MLRAIRDGTGKALRHAEPPHPASPAMQKQIMTPLGRARCIPFTCCVLVGSCSKSQGVDLSPGRHNVSFASEQVLCAACHDTSLHHIPRVS
jgi:hypothetical protein